MTGGVPLSLHPAQVRPVCEVIAALREGLGVEDIAARGICTEGFAREVIAHLRAHDCLDRVLGVEGPA